MYLLRCDWNLILKSVWAEYEIRKWQDVICSGSKYLEPSSSISNNSNKIKTYFHTKYNAKTRNLGILLPSNAFLALAAVSASVYWINACKMIQVLMVNYFLHFSCRGPTHVVSPENQQLFQMWQFYAQNRRQKTPKTKLKSLLRQIVNEKFNQHTLQV